HPMGETRCDAMSFRGITAKLKSTRPRSIPDVVTAGQRLEDTGARRSGRSSAEPRQRRPATSWTSTRAGYRHRISPKATTPAVPPECCVSRCGQCSTSVMAAMTLLRAHAVENRVEVVVDEPVALVPDLMEGGVREFVRLV